LTGPNDPAEVESFFTSFYNDCSDKDDNAAAADATPV